MASKNAIARRKYSCAFDECSPGEKAAVTREFDRQDAPAAPRRRAAGNDVITVEFGRPGVNGVKKVLVNKGTTVEEALEQSGLKINTSKEGVLDKGTGSTAMFKDAVEDGKLYYICPGIDSSW